MEHKNPPVERRQPSPRIVATKTSHDPSKAADDLADALGPWLERGWRVDNQAIERSDRDGSPVFWGEARVSIARTGE